MRRDAPLEGGSKARTCARWVLAGVLALTGCDDGPGPIGRVALPGAGDVTAVALDGHTLVALQAGFGLHVIDVARPEEPALLASVPGSVGEAVAAEGGLVATFDAEGCVRLFDLERPEAPAEVGSYTWENCGGEDLALVDATLIVAAGSRGLFVVDVADPSAPALIQAASSEVYAVAAGRTRASGLFATNFDDDRLVVWEVAEPRFDRSAPLTDLVASFRAHYAASDEHAVIWAAASDGPAVYDITGDLPVFVASVDPPGFSEGELALDGDVLAVLLPYDDSVRFYDLGTIGPELDGIGGAHAEDPVSLALGPDAAYVGAEGEVFVLPRPAPR
jgi:hypothetical protein